MRGVLLTSVVVMAVAGGAAVFGVRVYRAPGPLPVARDVVVPRGGLDEVGAALASAGAVRSRLAFKLAAAATFAEGPLHAAELRFSAHASLAEVLEVLRGGRPVSHRVTVAEGLTAAQIAQILARQGELLTGPIAVPAEGSVLPETYVFERGTGASTVLGRMQAAMRRAAESAWATRDAGLGLRSVRDAVVLASIVEHEARLPQERPMIARVFLNRLAAGMKLQADPTVSYGAEGGLGVLVRPIDRGDLARVDLYNSYVVPGLPAGPICSPGLASLKAVLHPATGNALYFVADGTGGHVFSATLSAHEANVARYRALVAGEKAGLLPSRGGLGR